MFPSLLLPTRWVVWVKQTNIKMCAALMGPTYVMYNGYVCLLLAVQDKLILLVQWVILRYSYFSLFSLLSKCYDGLCDEVLLFVSEYIYNDQRPMIDLR